MNLAMFVITLMVLEIAGLIMSINGSSGAETGTHMFWLGALAFTAIVGTTTILLV